MKDFSEISSDHIFRLIYVIRNAANYRSLLKYKDEFSQKYWIFVFNNSFDMSILEWCKVFGTDSEPTHWKKLVEEHDHDNFREGLLKHINLTDPEWDRYWREVKDYRNNLITHFRKDPKIIRYPSLDNIINSTFYYYEWLVKKLEEYGIKQEPEDLRGYYIKCLEQANLFSETAYRSTENIQEDVF